MSIAGTHQQRQTDLFEARTTPAQEDWRDQALCAQVGADCWFPEKGESAGDAKKICLACEVREQCLQYALANDERWGVWGGLSERERRRIKREPLGLPPLRLPPTRGAKCGTESGTRSHSRRGEESCDACKHASTEARRRRLLGISA